MKLIRNSSRLAMLAFIIIICITGCKSKKKAAELSNAAAEKAKIEREESLRRQKEEELRLAEQQRKEADEKARREAEERQRNEAKASAPAARLGQYFSAISSAGTPAAANSSITEALSLFASPETPVLIVISESGGQKDYDRPTTIKAYLNYLKDQKKNTNKVGNLQFDGSGKITEVELTKN